jgi:ribosome-associated protein
MYPDRLRLEAFVTIHLTDTVALNDNDIQERFVSAQGARGQNPDHDCTAVELRLDLIRTALPLDVKARLTALAGRHVTRDGVLVVTSRAFKSQAANRDAARSRLFAMLLRASKPPKARNPMKLRKADREQRLAEKHIRGHVKAVRARREPID